MAESRARRVLRSLRRQGRPKDEVAPSRPKGRSEVERPVSPRRDPSTRRAARLDVLRGPRGSRVNLGRVVWSGLDNVIGLGGSIPEVVPRQSALAPSSESQLQKAYDFKVEHNAILSFLIEDMWRTLPGHRERLRRHGSELGMVENFYSSKLKTPALRPLNLANIGTDIDSLREAMRTTLTDAIQKWDSQFVERGAPLSPQATGIEKAHARLEDILAFQVEAGASRSTSVWEDIDRGMYTATAAMWNVVEAAAEVFEAQESRPPTALECYLVIRNSYPLLVNLALGSDEMAIPFIQSLRGKPRDSGAPFVVSNLFLEGEGRSRRLAIDAETLDGTASTLHGVAFKDAVPVTKTTGCPALHSKTANGDNVIEDLWEWVLDLSRQTYLRQFDGIEELDAFVQAERMEKARVTGLSDH